MDSYSLDTHSLVWYIRGQKTVSSKAADIIYSAFKGENICYVSTMAILEAFYISLKHKNFVFSEFLKSIKSPNIRLISFDAKVLSQSLELPGKINIHDRIIVATAIVTNTRLVTKDRSLRSLFPLETIW